MGNPNRYTNLIKNLNTQAAEQGVYLICRLQKKQSKRIEVVGQEINEVSTARMKGLGLHLFDKEGRSVLTSTDNLGDESSVKATLKQAINSLPIGLNPPKIKRGVQPSRKPLRTKNPEIFTLKLQKDQINLAKNFDFNALTTTEIESKLLYLNQKIAEMGKTIGVGGNLKITSSFSIGQEAWRITRSDGTDVSWELPKTALATHLTYEKDGKKVDDHLSQFNPGWQIFTPLDSEHLKKYLQEVVFVIKLLKKSIDKLEYPAGNYPILIDSQLGGLLVHEAFGHAAESDAIYNNTSVLGENGKLCRGAEIASSIVSIVDETKPNTWGYTPYSAFGVPRGKIVIVRNGILQASLGDVFSGIKIGDQVRGASRIESYGDIPLPRMSRTYTSVGGKSPNSPESEKESDSLLCKESDSEKPDSFPSDSSYSPKAIQQKLLRNGLIKDRVLVLRRGRGGGQVNSRTGTFMFGFAYLYEITPDSIKLFRGSSFSGQTLEALKSIKAGFGKVDTHYFGSCGKGGQYVSVNDGANGFIFIEKAPHVTIGGS